MKSPNGWHLAAVLVVALALRLAVGFWWQSRLEGNFWFGDSESYWHLAHAVAQGEPYQYGPDGQVFRTPGYPALLSLLFLAADEPPAIWGRMLSALLGTLSVGGVWWMARYLFDARAGLAAAGIAAIYPGAVVTGALVLTEAPFGVFMLGHLILWQAAWSAKSSGRAGGLAFAAGLVAASATLVRPSWLLFTPFAIAVAVTIGKPRRRHLGLGFCMLGGLILAMTPWWVRNARVTGHFVPTTLQVGASLYDGLSPTATGASDMRFVPDVTRREQLQPAGAGGDPSDTFEYRLDQRMRSESLAWARSDPARVVQLGLIKLWRNWNIWPNEPSLRRWPIRLAVALAYLPVIVLAAVGAWRTRRRGWPFVLCWLPAVYFTLLHVVFVSSIRYRQPAMLPLMALAAGMIVLAVTERGGKREVGSG